MMRYKMLLIICSFVYELSAQEQQLQEGDIIFQDLSCDLCEAIEKVTTGYDGMDFSHCAMVVRYEGSLKVIEAVGEGVQLTDIPDFLTRQEGGEYIAGRLQPEQQYLIKEASTYALKQIGKPYDQVYLPDNGKWYCSELIHASFKYANDGEEVFPLEPMTFKDPDSGEFMEEWVEYYDKLKTGIPEGIPGINPGGISRSPLLDIFILKDEP